MNRMHVLPAMIAIAACLLATALPVPTQPPVRIVGAVQWGSSTSMAVMSDHGDSIMIDLMEADQSTYRGLRTEMGHHRRYAGAQPAARHRPGHLA